MRLQSNWGCELGPQSSLGLTGAGGLASMTAPSRSCWQEALSLLLSVVQGPQFVTMWAEGDHPGLPRIKGFSGCKIFSLKPGKSWATGRVIWERHQDRSHIFYNLILEITYHVIFLLYSVSHMDEPWYNVWRDYKRVWISGGRAHWSHLGSWLPYYPKTIVVENHHHLSAPHEFVG